MEFAAVELNANDQINKTKSKLNFIDVSLFSTSHKLDFIFSFLNSLNVSMFYFFCISNHNPNTLDIGC